MIPEITSQKIREYCETHSTKQNNFLQEIARLSQATHDPKMISGSFLGLFIRLISSLINPKFILEIGTFTGYGSMCLAEFLKPDGKLITIERDERMIGFSQKIFEESEYGKKIETLFGDASDLIPKLDLEFDLVYIDAAKKKYISHFEMILPKLRKGGVILADNVLWKGKVASEENDALGKALHEFNQHISKVSNIENIILPIDDGLNFIIKR